MGNGANKQNLHEKNTLPAFAQTIRTLREQKFPSTTKAAEAAGISFSYWNNIENLRVPATRGALEKIADALHMTQEERYQLFEDAASYHQQQAPEAAEAEQKWLRFQLVHTYNTPAFKLFEDEFNFMCVKVGKRAMGDYVIRDLANALKHEYQHILRDKTLRSSEQLAQALLDASGIGPSEVAEYTGLRPSEVSHLLHGHSGRNNVTTHSAHWHHFAEALMLDRLGL